MTLGQTVKRPICGDPPNAGIRLSYLLSVDCSFIKAVRASLPIWNINGPEPARRIYVERNIPVKDCAAKSMRDADRYLRIASRTPAENQHLATVLGALC